MQVQALLPPWARLASWSFAPTDGFSKSELFEEIGERAGWPAELVPEERERVGGAVDLLRQRIAEAVSRARLDLDINLRLRRLALDGGRDLVGMRRHHAVVVVGGQNQERRILPAAAHVVHRRIGDKRLEV